MAPSLRDGDLLLVAPPRRAPRRGRIVIIDTPGESGPRWQVKRVVGLPGERLAFEDGLLFINGTRLVEPYLGGLPAHPGLDSMSFDVEDNRYFILGDSRAHSDDSRSFGAIEAKRIAGIFVARLWPLVRMSGKLL